MDTEVRRVRGRGVRRMSVAWRECWERPSLAARSWGVHTQCAQIST